MGKYQRVDIKSTIQNAAPEPGFELTEKQIENLKTVGEVALAMAVLGGVIVLSAMAPNIFIALDKIFGKRQYGSKKETLEQREEQLVKSFYYMRRQGYIKIEKRGEILMVSSTKKSLRRMQKLQFDRLKIQAPRSWNGSWWFVLADIPSKYFRSQANSFQKKLKVMGFYSLQRTVWVYPFDPRKEVEAVAAHYRISSFVTSLEAKQLDESDEQLLLKFFQDSKVL